MLIAARATDFDQPVRPKARVLRPIATTPRPAADPDKEAFSRTQLDRCSNAITPACLQALYAIPEDRSAFIADDNSFGVPEFGNIFQFKDFDRFARNFSQDAVGYRPEVLNIDGADFPQNLSNIDALDFSIEANLDLQYAIALTHVSELLTPCGSAVADGPIPSLAQPTVPASAALL